MVITASDKKLCPAQQKIILFSEEYHNNKINNILHSHVKLFQNDGKQKTTVINLHKDTSNLFRYIKKSQDKLDLRSFNKVLSIDTINFEAEIEGMTTYEEIVKITLQHGFLPTVIPELKSITIGGALAGVAIESSAFRYGLVHETILEYEVLLGNGQIITCRPDNEYRDLYYALPNTYGTLGYVLKVKVKIIPIKPYIKITHHKYQNAKAYFDTINNLCRENRLKGSIAYLDGTIFDNDEMYITTGEFMDEAPFVSNYRYLNIYYQSIKEKQIDYLTTENYIWRWDPDWFWCSKHFLMQNKLCRLLFGKLLLKSTNYWKIRQFIHKHKWLDNIITKIYGPTETIIQDIQVPIQESMQFLNFFTNTIGIKPIWMCPTQSYQNITYPFYKMKPDILYINFGFWDMKPSDMPKGFYNKEIEKIVEELGGNKSLYSDIYYTPTEFWQIYDKALYNELKKKYDSNYVLNDLYHKCKKAH